MSPVRRLTTATAVFILALVTIGGVVRATGSGLGCPDWPLCFGDWLPPADLHAWIEHSHRLTAAVFVGPLVGAVGPLIPLARERGLLLAIRGGGHGFIGHAEDTAAWARAHTRHLALVVNTNWHADHVGGNGLLQATGAGIAASAPDAAAVAHQARVDELVRRSGVIAISPAVTGLLGPSRRRHMRRWPGRCRGTSSPGPPFSATVSLAWWTAMEPVTGAG